MWYQTWGTKVAFLLPYRYLPPTAMKVTYSSVEGRAGQVRRGSSIVWEDQGKSEKGQKSSGIYVKG